ncbi:hypothetical protein MK489_08740 [Myxococcota bacterium]|nr:hypothetical protein [Myxococcota bacterium]
MSEPVKRSEKKSIYLFAVQAALLIVLATQMPDFTDLYARAFHAEANVVLKSLPEGSKARLRTPLDRTDNSDTEMLGYQQGRFSPVFTARFKIHERGYWSLVSIAALVIATPLPWLRRLWALGLGLFLVNLFTLLQVWGLAVVSFGVAAGGENAELWRRLASACHGMFNSEMTRLLAVLSVWALVARPARFLDVRRLREVFAKMGR